MNQGRILKTLGDVCEKGSSNISQNQLDNEFGEYPIFGASGLIKKISFYHQAKPYLSIVKDGSGYGRVTKMNAFSTVIGTLQYIIPKDNVDLDYLYYSLLSVDFKKYVAGAAIPHIYFKDYKNEPFFWIPLSEQQHIVAILDKAFAAIDNAKANSEQNLINARELFDSFLQGVYNYDKTSWEVKTLEEVVNKDCTLSYGIVQPGGDFENGLPVVRPTDLTQKLIYKSGLKLIDPKLAGAYKRTILNGNDLLLCVRGTTGVISIATEELKGANVTRGIVPIRFDVRKINQLFGYYTLISKYVQEQIKNKTYGTALMQINIGDLRKLKILFPKSLLEQQNIVHQLEILNDGTKKLEAIYQKKIADLGELKKSILYKAFNGELNTSKDIVV
jgi:type I restriction enzyme, S subunit